MTRARELAKLANPEVFSVDSSNNVGVNSLTPDAKLDVVGVVSATQYFGDGSNLTGIVAGATLNASSGIQRLVVTSQTSGSMTQAATNADIAYNTSTNTLSATNFSGTLLGNATGLQGTPSITVQDVAAEKVSIAGTISYEDVTNVNSVGIITANKGIKVPNYGMTVTGVVTATSYQGDGSSLTGVESGVSNFVASGAIGNGQTVVIKTDGTAGIVTETVTGPNVGSAVAYNTSVTQSNSIAYDSTNNRVVVAYRDQGNSYYGTARVGTVDPSDNSITFGSEVVFNTGDSDNIAATYDPSNDRVVISYNDNGNNDKGTSIVGDVDPSNNSITFGSEVVFNNETTYDVKSTYDSTNNKVIISFRNSSGSGFSVAAISGTVNAGNNSISFGSEVSIGGNLFEPTPIYDSTNQKLVLICRNQNNYGKAYVASVNGDSISFGSEQSWSGTDQASKLSGTFDSTNGKVVIGFRDGGNNSYGTAKVGTVSGNGITFGNGSVFESATTEDHSMVYNSTLQKVVIVYRDNGNSGSGTAVDGTVSGTSISFGTHTVLENDNDKISSAYDSTNDRVVISLRDGGNSNYGTSFVYRSRGSSTNLTAENYIGIAAEAIANGATGKITTVGGINSGQTGLTTAQTYYVQNNGTLATSAGNPSVVAGTAVSNTKVLVWKS